MSGNADIVRVGNSKLIPDFLHGQEIVGVETLKEFVSPPRLRLVQKSSKQNLLDLFKPGTAILRPGDAVFIEKKAGTDATDPVKIVPLFFFPQWTTYAPQDRPQSVPFTLYQTQKPDDPIVKKSRAAETRVEKGYRFKDDKGVEHVLDVHHVEELVFICMPYDHPLSGQPIVVTFSKTGWTSGSKFSNLINLRRAPIFACVFELRSVTKRNAKGEWAVLDVQNPADGQQWVNKNEYEAFKLLYEGFAKASTDGRIRVQDDEPEEPGDAGSGEDLSKDEGGKARF